MSSIKLVTDIGEAQQPLKGSDGAAHVFIDGGIGIDRHNRVVVVEQGQFDYETVAPSQSAQVLGVTGALGDFLHKLICVVTTAATAQVQIKDGTNTAITVLPNSPGGGVGTYSIELNIVSTNGPWQITTAAGVSVIAIGRFAP